MILFNQSLLDEYKNNDVTLKKLKNITRQPDELFASHQWLLDSLPKRMIYNYIYGDLIEPNSKRNKILDVGGGYCSVSRSLIQYNDYTLLDIMAHDNHNNLKSIEKSLNKKFWINSDWFYFNPEIKYDIIISNDLFTNVDQRIELFLEKYLPLCNEMRLSITYYNIPRYYTVKRVDADEILNIIAWDGFQVRRVLEKFNNYIIEFNVDIFNQNPKSLFNNNRQVIFIKMKNNK